MEAKMQSFNLINLRQSYPKKEVPSLHYLDAIPPTQQKKNPTRKCRVCIEYWTLYIGLCYKSYHEDKVS